MQGGRDNPKIVIFLLFVITLSGKINNRQK
jgi:hypothetical protein